MNIVRITTENIELVDKALSFIFSSSSSVNINYFSNPNNYFYVAMEDEEMVGAIYGHEFDRPDTGKKQLFIYSLDVKKGHRRKGYATLLVNHFIDIAKSGDYHNVFLLANDDNMPAIKLYDSISGKKMNKKVVEQILYAWY